MDLNTYHSGHALGNEHWIIRPNPSGDYILPAADAKTSHQPVSLLRLDDEGNVLHSANPIPQTEPERFAAIFFGLVPKSKWLKRPR